MWWLKFLSAVAAGVISVAGVGRVLGVSIDIQSRSAAAAEHEALAKRADERLAAAVNGLRTEVLDAIRQTREDQRETQRRIDSLLRATSRARGGQP